MTAAAVLEAVSAKYPRSPAVAALRDHLALCAACRAGGANCGAGVLLRLCAARARAKRSA